jgi:hypothetical protein
MTTAIASPARAYLLVACASVLAACQSSAPVSDAPASNEAHMLARRIGETIGRCWFAANETAFAGYIYSPEPNAVTPRVLIVRRDQPAERPVLVVEARSATAVASYGPLIDTPIGPRIRSDLDRWAKGGDSCA